MFAPGNREPARVTDIPERLRADFGLAYAVLRLTMGVNFFFHGATRIPHLAAFVAMTVREFAATGLPPLAVQAFAYAIPFVEIVLGAALVFGVALRAALVAAAAYMVVLMFGTLVRAQYTVVAEQLEYSLAFVLLIGLRSFDRFSIDASRSATHAASRRKET
jgi:thiosulfate dehydrogenase [quinone] large subunit